MQAKERCNGLELDGRKIRVDYSITKRAHTPTPGVYMGKPTRSSYDERGGGGRYDDDDYHDRGKKRKTWREREKRDERDSEGKTGKDPYYNFFFIFFQVVRAEAVATEGSYPATRYFLWTTLHHTLYVLKIVTCTL